MTASPIENFLDALYDGLRDADAAMARRLLAEAESHLRESADAYLFWVDQMLEEVNLLLQVHLAMSSKRTNEVMRVLTVFSAFFLPLTFIVGIYGMNFQYMPELAQHWGYPAVLLAMAGIAAAIWLWFRRRGWMG